MMVAFSIGFLSGDFCPPNRERLRCVRPDPGASYTNLQPGESITSAPR
jgi:hypothetical protein